MVLPGDGACVVAENLRRGSWSRLNMAYNEQLAWRDAWDPLVTAGNPCDAPLVESFLVCVSKEHEKRAVPVK